MAYVCVCVFCSRCGRTAPQVYLRSSFTASQAAMAGGSSNGGGSGGSSSAASAVIDVEVEKRPSGE